MKKSFGTLFPAILAAFVLVGFAMAPAAEAARGGGARAGGGGGAQASARSGGGASARASGGAGTKQVNNSNRDVRANNVRNTSVNNVNVDRNVNVNVEGGGCCHNGWDNDYHPVATAAAVTATAAVIGSMVRTIPPSCVPVNYSGMIYQQCGSTWYQPQGSQYVVVNPPY